MELSICIVSYECRQKLRGCLRSLRTHRPPVEHEVIVVDNGSGDGTVEMLEDEFYWVEAITNEENRGFSAACNQGLATARGELLMVLNPDVEILHNSFEELLQFIRERPWIGAVGPKLVTPDGRVERSCRQFPTMFTGVAHLSGIPRALSTSKVFGRYVDDTEHNCGPRSVGWLSGAALMFTGKAWDKAGPFDEQFFLAAADLDWQKRLQRVGLERWYLPSTQIIHYPGRSWDAGETGKAEEASSFYLAMFRYFKKHHGMAAYLMLRGLTALASAVRLPWCSLAMLPPQRRKRARKYTQTAWGMLRTALGFPSRSE